MEPNPDNPTIPVNCADYVLPTDVGVEDCFNPVLLYGPGTELFLSLTPFPSPVAPATEAVTAASYAAKKQAATPEKLIGPIICQLSLAPAADQSDRINGFDYPKPTDLSLAVTIQDLSDANYEMARKSQQGGIKAHFWFQDRNGKFYGGQNGIFGGLALMNLRVNLPTDETALQTITGTIKARGFFDPKRQDSPIPLI